MSIRPIIVGWDGSPGAEEAVRWAAHTAARHHRTLRIIHVVKTGPAPSRSFLAGAEAVAREAEPTLRVHSGLLRGQPLEALRTLSAPAGALVVGTRGHSRLRTALVGSVSEGLTQQADGPVVVVRGRTDHHPSAPIVVGVDGSEISAAAIGYAARYAETLGAPLVAVTAVPDPLQSVAPEAYLTEEHAAIARRDAERIVQRAVTDIRTAHPGLIVESRVCELEPLEALVEAAEDAQVLIVGTHGRSGFGGVLFGSVSRTLLHHAPCPVAVVRPRRGLNVKGVESAG